MIGFDVVLSWGSALFVSAGGYHHHLGLNTWAGVGAPPPPPDAAGICYYTVALPSQAARDQVIDRVKAAQIAVEEHERGPLVRDPSQNAVVFTVE